MSKEEKYLEITAKPKNGFRRAGHRFGATPTKIPVDNLTNEEILALKSDANLVVHEVSAGEQSPATNNGDAIKFELFKAQGDLEKVSQERDSLQVKLDTANNKLKTLEVNLKNAKEVGKKTTKPSTKEKSSDNKK